MLRTLLVLLYGHDLSSTPEGNSTFSRLPLATNAYFKPSEICHRQLSVKFPLAGFLMTNPLPTRNFKTH